MGYTTPPPVESRHYLVREALEVVEHRRQILVRVVPHEVGDAEVGVRADVARDLVGRALEERALARRRFHAPGPHLHGHADGERDLLRIAPGVLGPLLQLPHAGRVAGRHQQAGRPQDDRMPAVAEPRGPPHGGVGVAADPDRDTLRPHGLGQHVDGAHAHVATIEGDGIGRPRRAPTASNSSRSQPTPAPSRMRPPDRRSSVARIFAVTNG